MSLHPLQPLTSHALLALASQLGFSLDLTLLEALEDGRWIVALASPGQSEARYCPLHVMALQAYEQAARVRWEPGVTLGAPDLSQLEAWTTPFHEAILALHRHGVEGRGQRGLQRLRELVQQLLLDSCPLHGPVRELVAMTRHEVWASWPAPARRWAQLVDMAAQLDAMAHGEDLGAPTLQLQSVSAAAAMSRRTVELPSLSERATQPTGLRVTQPVTLPALSPPRSPRGDLGRDASRVTDQLEAVSSDELALVDELTEGLALAVTEAPPLAEPSTPSLADALEPPAPLDDEPPVELLDDEVSAPSADAADAHEPDPTPEDTTHQAPSSESAPSEPASSEPAPSEPEPAAQAPEAGEPAGEDVSAPSPDASPKAPEQAPEDDLEAGVAPPSSQAPLPAGGARPAQLTTRTIELNKRLEALRSLDGRRTPELSIKPLSAASAARSPASASASPPADHPAESPPEPSHPAAPPEALPGALEVEVEEVSDAQALELVESSELLMEPYDELIDVEQPDDLAQVKPSSSAQAEASIEAPIEASIEAPIEAPIEASIEDQAESNVDAEVQAAPAAEDPRVQQRLLAERIHSLNKQRELFMREQNWRGLANLYEEGIELFEAQERQQIYLTLAKLYELKLMEPERALQNTILAAELALDEADRARSLALVQRLAMASKLYEPALVWWRAQRASGWALRWALASGQAQLMVAAGQLDEALAELTAWIHEHAAQALATSQALEALEELAPKTPEGAERLKACLDGLLEQPDLTEDARFMVAAFAGMGAVERDDDAAATRYLWRAIKLRPTDEAVFHTLASVLEEEQRWDALVALHDMRLALEPEHPTLLSRQQDLLERELAQTDAAIARYSDQLKRHPDDIVALERLVLAHTLAGRVGEIYGFLSRHLELTRDSQARAQVLYALAQVAMEQLQAPEEATIHLERVAELHEGDQRALETLMATCARYEIWSVVLHVIEQGVRSQTLGLTTQDLIQWYLIGAQAAGRAERLLEQRRFLQNILALDPSHPDALHALSTL